MLLNRLDHSWLPALALLRFFWIVLLSTHILDFHFASDPIYSLRHVFCTRLSEVAPDAVVQRAMRHTSPETKRHYQLGMAEQVRQAVEKTNKRLYGKRVPL
jgi:hypothetical protein